MVASLFLVIPSYMYADNTIIMSSTKPGLQKESHVIYARNAHWCLIVIKVTDES